MKIFPMIDDYILFLEDYNVFKRSATISCIVDNVSKMFDIPQGVNLYKEMMRRERIMTTAIGDGLAFPHAKTSMFSSFLLYVGINKLGIKWPSIDHEDVVLVFCVLGPYETQRSEYLDLLGVISMSMSNNFNKANIMFSSSKKFICGFFNEIFSKV